MHLRVYVDTILNNFGKESAFLSHYWQYLSQILYIFMGNVGVHGDLGAAGPNLT
jgi:hypothetical protein